jgi:alkylhydroperoxidase family enzyme
VARIPYHDLQNIPVELSEMIAARRPLNLYRMLPHAVTIMPGFLKMGLAIRTETSLAPKIREMVILRTGALMNARYEMHQHRRIAKTEGIAQQDIDAACTPGNESGCGALEQLVLRFTDAVVQQPKVPDALFNAIVEKFECRGACELLLTAGFYMMVSRFLENTGVDIENKPASSGA